MAACRRLTGPLSPVISGVPEGARRPLCEGLTLRLLTRKKHTGSLRCRAAWGRESCSHSWEGVEPGGFELRTAPWLTRGLPAPWKGEVYPGSLASRCQSSQLGPNHVSQLSMRVQSLLSLWGPPGLGSETYSQSVRWTNDERAILKWEGRGSPLAPLTDPRGSEREKQ